jgi:hypothetical protein
MIFLFYSDEVAIDVKTGLVTRQELNGWVSFELVRWDGLKEWVDRWMGGSESAGL